MFTSESKTDFYSSQQFKSSCTRRDDLQLYLCNVILYIHPISVANTHMCTRLMFTAMRLDVSLHVITLAAILIIKTAVPPCKRFSRSAIGIGLTDVMQHIHLFYIKVYRKIFVDGGTFCPIKGPMPKDSTQVTCSSRNAVKGGKVVAQICPPSKSLSFLLLSYYI